MKVSRRLFVCTMITVAFLCLPLQATANETMGKSNDQMTTGSSENMMKPAKAQNKWNAADEIVIKAAQAFQNATVTATPGNSMPAPVIANAAGVAIFPDYFSAAVVVGGSHGSGVLLAKQNNGNWSPPLFVSMSGASLGAQVGVESTDLILVFRNRQTFDQVAKSHNFKLGVDASVAAGSASATGTKSTESAQILAYRYSSGLFAGAAVDGSVLNISQEPTIAYYQFPSAEGARGYYGSDVTLFNHIIGANGKTELKPDSIPQSANNLRQLIFEYAAQFPKSTE